MKIKTVLPIVILLGFAGASLIMANMRQDPAKIAVEPPSLLVEVTSAVSKPVNFFVSSQGTVGPRTQTNLVAEASGQIVEVSNAFVSGGFFNKGDVLVRVDPRNYQSALKKARASVARAETMLAKESALAGYARDDYDRLRKLKPGTGPASALALRKPQLQEAISELQFAEAELDKAEGDLERTVIKAPYVGLVREKRADVGQYVNTGSALATTIAVDVAEIRLPVTQRDLAYLDIDKIRRGKPLPVTISAELGGSIYTWQGQIVRSEGVFDATSRVLYLVAQISDPYQLGGNTEQVPLLIGTYVSAEITGRAGGNLFLIPRHSLHLGKTLWLVDEDSRIRPVDVSVVRSDESFYYVEGGIPEGAKYCVTPLEKPLPGQRVRVSS
jgi:RND family efflux transporter MFP subunit